MIIYKLRDPERAPALARAFETLFQHESQSWQDREEANLQLFLTLQDLGRHHGFADYSAGRFRHFQCADHVGAVEGQRDRDSAFDGISPARHLCDFPVAGGDDRRGRLGARLFVGALLTWGVSQFRSGPRLDLRKPLSGHMGLAPLPLGHHLAIIAVFIASYVPARRAAFLPRSQPSVDRAPRSIIGG